MTDRILGTQKSVTVPTRNLVTLTGNNPIISDDLNRRLLRATIDPVCERPDMRVFELRPLEYVRNHRLELVRAAILILKKASTQVQDLKVSGFASFETWSDFIRKAVIWVGQKGWLDVGDPCETLSEAFTIDPESSKLRALLHAWREEFSKQGATVPEAIRIAQKIEDGPLSEAIQEIAGERGHINPRRLGRWIESHTGRILEGLAFHRAGKRKDRVVWAVGLVGSNGVVLPLREKCQVNNIVTAGVTFREGGDKNTVQTDQTDHGPTCDTCMNFVANSFDRSKQGLCECPPDCRYSKMPFDGADCHSFERVTH